MEAKETIKEKTIDGEDIAGKNCKTIYVTDDNPRKEKPERIRSELVRQLNNANHFNIDKLVN